MKKAKAPAIKPAPEALPCLAYGPLSYDDNGYIWAPSLKGGDDNVANVRGWGYLTGGGHGALGLPEKEALAAQHTWGHTIVDSINARFYPPPEKAAAIARLSRALTAEARWVEARCFGETDQVLVSKSDLRLLLNPPAEEPDGI